MLTPMQNPRRLTLTLCTLLAAGGLLGLAFHLILAAGGDKHSELSGTWVMQPFYQEQERDALDPRLMHWTLTLNDDGTFTEHLKTYVMVRGIVNTRGKYTRSGAILTLTGTSEGYRDDGYVKGPFKEPFAMKLRYAGNALTILGDRTGDMAFRREGEHAPPRPKLGPSDPKALRIVHEMERRYAALQSYSDEGTLTSSGAGFMWENARFRTRFVRPHKFRFQATAIADGKEWDKNVVWSDGKKTWLYDGSVGGSEERPLGNALGTISPTSGYETMLVPGLLLPAEFGGPNIDASFEEISLAGEDKVSEKDCYVIAESNPEGWHLKLWIDKSSYLILRAFDKMANATITYQPKCNIKIADSEFRFSPPK